MSKVRKNPVNKENSLIVKPVTAALVEQIFNLLITANKVSSVLSLKGLSHLREFLPQSFINDLDRELSKPNTRSSK